MPPPTILVLAEGPSPPTRLTVMSRLQCSFVGVTRYPLRASGRDGRQRRHWNLVQGCRLVVGRLGATNRGEPQQRIPVGEVRRACDAPCRWWLRHHYVICCRPPRVDRISRLLRHKGSGSPCSKVYVLCLFFRHCGQPKAGEVSGFEQGADFRHPEISGGLQVGDARITTVNAQASGFGEFCGSAFTGALEGKG